MASNPLTRIVAAGSGRMGRGMAVAFAYAGHSVQLLDLKVRSSDEFAEHLVAVNRELDDILNSLQRIGIIDSADIALLRDRILLSPRTQASDVLGDSQLVIEGVPERLVDKKSAFELLESHMPVDAILASTTSSFLSTDLAALLTFPRRFLNMHWLNPSYLIPLVELSPHKETDPSVTDAVVACLTSIGKAPVVCSPSPGYIVPRLQALIMNEAARMVEEGVANAKDVDTAVRLGFGMRYASMGLLEFVDFGGLDILYYASQSMSEAIDPARFAAPKIVNKLMSEGKTGVRTGQGLYDWRDIDVAEYRDSVTKRLANLLQREGFLRPPVRQEPTRE